MTKDRNAQARQTPSTAKPAVVKPTVPQPAAAKPAVEHAVIHLQFGGFSLTVGRGFATFLTILVLAHMGANFHPGTLLKTGGAAVKLARNTIQSLKTRFGRR
jgi:hypothetical protein